MASECFCLERRGATLILAPQHEVGSLSDSDIRAATDRALEAFAQGGLAHVLVDYAQAPYFGSCMLEAQVRLRKAALAQGGRLAVCNVSTVGREVLSITRLDTVCPIFDSRDEALESIEAAGA